MPDKFNMQSPPFDRLTQSQQQSLMSALDISYFRTQECLLHNGQSSESLYILIKGVVEERTEDHQEIFAHYTSQDMFDVRALFEGTVKHDYVALEDTLSYILPKSVFLELYHQNGQFAAYFDNNLATRQTLIKTAQQQQNLAEFILTKVDHTVYHPPLICSPAHTIKDVTEQLRHQKNDAALILLDDQETRLQAMPMQTMPDTPPYAIVTRTDLLHALADGHSLTTAVGEIATFPVVSIHEGDFIFNAMITMIRHKIKRVMICDGKTAVGLLDITQILSIFSTHSHVLTLSIARAATIEELAMAANQQKTLVNNLMSQGIRTRFIMALVSAVNEQIIEKAFELVVPPFMHQHCCFLVLGSEGRGEQILKTDQDNALIIEDGVIWDECPQVMNQLSQTLSQLGYPLCPGRVMVNNPYWVQTQNQWQHTLTQWVTQENPEQLMHLAIMADAHAIAGNRALLTPVKAHLSQLMVNQTLLLTQFTRPALSFSSPLTLFGNVKSAKSGINIKQGGIFPIVHGVRALSLEHQITPRNTFERLEMLAQRHVLEPQTSENLSEALKQFFKFRLQQQLHRDQTGNHLDISLLDHTERDLLRHSLHIVKKFKQWLAYHYQIHD